VDERALEVEPTDQLSPFVGHEGRTIAGRRHYRHGTSTGATCQRHSGSSDPALEFAEQRRDAL